MLRVDEIMTSDVITVAPEMSLRDAMEVFSHHHVSGAPVVAGDRVVGVVSSTDLIMLAASLSGVPTEREAPDDDAGDGLADMATEEPDDAPVPAFFNDFWDDAGANIAARFDAISGPEWNVLQEHDVSEAMTRLPLLTLPPNASVEWAAEMMRHNHVHRILITEGERLVGIVSALDIVGAVADRRFVVRQFVFNSERVFADS